MSKPSAPPQPDYKGAAEAQSASQKSTQITPYGSMEWDQYSPAGTSDRIWRSTVNLAPQAQQTLDTQMGLSQGLAQTASDQLPGIQDFYSKPLDYKTLSQPAYDAMTSRLDPEWQQRESMQETKLANQGLVPGGEAYDNAMRTFGQGRNDAYQQANLASLQNASQFYNQPLNTFNALRTGAQVQNPQFQAQGPGTNYLGAAQAQGQGDQFNYGQKVGTYNSMLNGLFGLGAAGIMG